MLFCLRWSNTPCWTIIARECLLLGQGTYVCIVIYTNWRFELDNYPTFVRVCCCTVTLFVKVENFVLGFRFDLCGVFGLDEAFVLFIIEIAGFVWLYIANYVWKGRCFYYASMYPFRMNNFMRFSIKGYLGGTLSLNIFVATVKINEFDRLSLFGTYDIFDKCTCVGVLCFMI